MPRYLGKVGGVRWDVQRPPCLPTSAANVGTRGGGGGPTFAPEVQRAGGNVPRATSTLASDSDGTLHAAESEMRWVVQIGRHPSPCRCDSSHLVAPSHLPAAGCACLGGHSVRRSRGLSLVSSRLSRTDVREATLGTRGHASEIPAQRASDMRRLDAAYEQAVFETREHALCTPSSSKTALKSSRRSFGLHCRRERNVVFACNAPQCDVNEA